MRKTSLIFILFILFQGCYTTTRNPDKNAYYDGFHESEPAKTDEAETEVVYENSDETVNGDYYYDPYYMNRYMITRYDHAWYWRSMYRPYGYRHHRNFSIYFGYSSGPLLSSYYDYYSYDPYYDYYWNDYSYWNDYYSPHNYNYGSIYRPYSYYPRTIVYVGDGSSSSSNERRGYNRLGQTSGGVAPTNPNPVPYYIPNIAIIPPSNPSSSSVSIQKFKKTRALESNHKKRKIGKGTKTRTIHKPRKEASNSSSKKSSVRSAKNKPRRQVARPRPKSNTSSKGHVSKVKSKSKKSDK